MSKVRFIHRVEYGGLRFGLWLLGTLPTFLSYGLLARVSDLFLLCAPKRRRIGLENLARAIPDLPPKEANRIIRRSTANSFHAILDMVLCIKRTKRGTLLDAADVSSYANQAPEKGPYIGFTGHLGSWEYALFAVGQMVGGAVGIGRPPSNPLSAAYLEKCRGASSTKVFPKRGGIRSITRTLRDGGIALQVGDQNQRMRGAFVPWFGKIASTERSVATLAVRNGYPIILGCCARVGRRFQFKFDMEPPFVPENTGNPEADVLAACRKINEMLEQVVLRYPEQYLWIHERYKTQPEDEAVQETEQADGASGE